MTNLVDNLKNTSNAMIKAGIHWIKENSQIAPEFNIHIDLKGETSILPLNSDAQTLLNKMHSVTEIIPEAAKNMALSAIIIFLNSKAEPK